MPDIFEFEPLPVQNDDTADITDVYVFHEIQDSDFGKSESTADAAIPFDLLDSGTAKDDATPFDFPDDSADAFVFVTAGSGNGSATADNSPPAPKPEPPKYDIKYEWLLTRDTPPQMKKIATLAYNESFILTG